MSMEKRLYRSRNMRMVSGVCGGLAEYFNADVSVVRLIVAICILITGVLPGLVLYLVASIVIPEDDGMMSQNSSGDPQSYHSTDYGKTLIYIGGFLVFLGAVLLLKRFIPFNFGSYFWPLVLIIIGILVVLRSVDKKNND